MASAGEGHTAALARYIDQRKPDGRRLRRRMNGPKASILMVVGDPAAWFLI